MTQLRYATLEEMQDMEFGATGDNVRKDGAHFERLMNDDIGATGWAIRYDDADGSMIDWDRISEDEARKIGIWPL